MPTTHIWAVTNQGEVYTLSTNCQQWEKVVYCGMEFKRVSSVGWCSWAIGGDHHLYVYVFATDVPIRFKEVAYENQRWNPKEGFCARLLPTDRPQWSTKDGQTARFRERIKLPTLSWQWENDWQVEHNYDGGGGGQSVDPEGWMYAVDFPAKYGREKNWLSYVRRRKWIRLRRYVTTNNWANVPGIHDDPVKEPFIDVAVGGQDLLGGNSDSLAVWTVTVLGRVMFRKGVSTSLPEGVEWLHVTVPQGWEVNQLSVGSTGLVWAITWNGWALVRMGVDRNALEGTHWVRVEPPTEDSKLLQVSVGTNAVWAITRDNKVWFRKGVRASESIVLEDCAKGTGWIEMVGEMCLVSVGLNDQVWSLGADERKTLYIRTGVIGQDLCGKTWKPILLPRINGPQSYSSSEESVPRLDNSRVDLATGSFNVDTDKTDVSLSETVVPDDELFSVATTNESFPFVNIPTEDVNRSADIVICGSYETKSDFEASGESQPSSSNSSVVTGRSLAPSLPGTPRLSVKSRVSSLTSLQSSINWVSTEDTGYFDDASLDSTWSWISGGGCFVDGQNLPSWFTPGMICHQTVPNEPWRKEILVLLAKRHTREIERFSEYEQAIDKSSWVITVKAQVLLEGRQSNWEDCKLELEKTREEEGLESATLRCFVQGSCPPSCEKFVFTMSSVTCTVCISDHQKLVLAVYTARRIIEKRPLCIAFSSDSELEDWLTLLSNTCCETRGIRGAPSPKAIWSLTSRGDIFTHDPFANSDSIEKPNELFWRQLGGHLQVVESCSAGIVWGIGYNRIPWIYTGGWGGGFFKGMDNSNFGINSMHDVRQMYIYENQRWNPLTGFSIRRLPTDRYMWSDKSGRRECTKENTKLPSMHWQWTTDWMVDFHTPGGVDREGWQYAKDFPMMYHGSKGLTDYVRRRRWYRKCKFSSSGPWEELDSVRLLDISMQVDHSGCPITPIRLWAVSVKGEVLCRIGVTQSCPKGIYWEHVVLDQVAQSISVGGLGEVWVVTKNGNAFLRHGITDQMPTGSVWFVVGPPEKGSPLRRISAGPATVWAVDATNNLWFRREIMPLFPEGTHWKHVCGNVRCVSVGPNDQVWGITDIPGSTTGIVCRRAGITNENEIGTNWEYGIGGSWHYISVRGLSCVLKT